MFTLMELVNFNICNTHVVVCFITITIFCGIEGRKRRIPDFVFLAHGVDVVSSLHAPFIFRSFSSKPFSTRFFLLPLWPISLLVILTMWAFAKTFPVSFYELKGRLFQLWAVPRFGFQVTVLVL